MSEHHAVTTSADVAQMSEQYANDHPGHMAFMADVYDPLAFHQYPWMGIMLSLVLYFGSLLADKSLAFFSPSFWGKELCTNKKRIAITYIHELVVTTISVFFLFSGGFRALKGDMANTTSRDIEQISYSVTMIVTLYVWELVYRHSFGVPLMIHHLVSICMVQAMMIDLNKAPDLDRLQATIIIAFTATTEQTSFIALLLHRFKQRRAASILFYIAAAQSLIIKTAAFIATLSIFARAMFVAAPTNGYSHFWKWGFAPLVVALYASQAYACWILICLGRRCARELKNGAEECFSATTSSGSTGTVVIPTSLPAAWQRAHTAWPHADPASNARAASSSCSIDDPEDAKKPNRQQEDCDGAASSHDVQADQSAQPPHADLQC